MVIDTRRNKFFGGLAAVLFLLGILSGCGKKETGKTSSIPESIPVRVVRVELRDLEKSLDYVGDIKSKEEVVIYPKVSGKIIEKMKEDGSAVEKGEALAYIDRDEVGLTYQRAPVESAITGVVGRMYVDLGTQVVANVTPVAIVVNTEKMKIDIRLPEIYISKVVLGQVAQIFVDAYAGQDFSGVVTKIAPVLDAETRSALVEISVADPDQKLKSGMFGKARLIIEKKPQVPVIPKEAILGRGDDMFVFAVENDKAVSKKIKIALIQGAEVGVSDGLKAGDHVVIFGQHKLTEGASVKMEVAE